MDEQMIVELTLEMIQAGAKAFNRQHGDCCYPVAMDAEAEGAAIKIYGEMVRADTRAAHSVIAGKVAELEDWAFEQSRLHHQLAVENEPLRTEHIASSTAYRELGLKLREQAALAPYPERRSE